MRVSKLSPRHPIPAPTLHRFRCREDVRFRSNGLLRGRVKRGRDGLQKLCSIHPTANGQHPAPHRSNAHAYVDDICFFSKTLDEHVKHQDAVFATLAERRVRLEPTKSFLGYPSVQLLGQQNAKGRQVRCPWSRFCSRVDYYQMLSLAE